MRYLNGKSTSLNVPSMAVGSQWMEEQPPQPRVWRVSWQPVLFAADHDVRKRIDSTVHRGIAFLLNAQIKEGPFAGAFPPAVGRLNQNTPEAKEFNNRATEVRIDYVQHALSAMIQYLHLF